MFCNAAPLRDEEVEDLDRHFRTLIVGRLSTLRHRVLDG